jgi:acetyl coenzyme A synthetase (ADP forming)-like protein
MVDARHDDQNHPRRSAKSLAFTKIGLERFFSPRTVAVIGASNNSTRFGYNVMKNLIEGGFDGAIFPVSLKEDLVFGRTAYKSVLNIPDSVDLAVIIIPAENVSSAVEECGRKGIKAVSVLSGGFSEIGSKGAELQHRVLETADKYGVRIVGPNCVGTMNTHQNLNASFIMYSAKGDLGLITQSGALGASCSYISRREMLGFSKFMNLGNASDVSVPEVIEYYGSDPETLAIGIYLEGVQDGHKFVDAISKVAIIKPIIVVKAGRTEAGAKAATSHTGSLAGSDKIYGALFKQKGVIRASSLFELIDIAKAFVRQPLPKGRRVGVMTNAGGAGVLATDAAADRGLVMPSLAQETINTLKGFLPDVATLVNPVDIIASADRECYRKTTEAMASDPNIDALIVNCVVPTFLGMKPSEHAEGVVEAYKNKVQDTGKPILCCWMAGDLADPGRKILEDANIPSYSSPEKAAIALSGLIDYQEFTKRVRREAK